MGQTLELLDARAMFKILHSATRQFHEPDYKHGDRGVSSLNYDRMPSLFRTAGIENSGSSAGYQSITA